MSVLFAIAALSVLIALTAMWLALDCGRLARARMRAVEDLARLDDALRCRHALIAPLVRLVGAHVPHEQGAIHALVQARDEAVNATVPALGRLVENQLAVAVGNVVAIGADHPSLRHSEEFAPLVYRIDAVEAEIQAAVTQFNAVAGRYNLLIRPRPYAWIARRLDYHTARLVNLESVAVPSASLAAA